MDRIVSAWRKRSPCTNADASKPKPLRRLSYIRSSSWFPGVFIMAVFWTSAGTAEASMLSSGKNWFRTWSFAALQRTAMFTVIIKRCIHSCNLSIDCKLNNVWSADSRSLSERIRHHTWWLQCCVSFFANFPTIIVIAQRSSDVNLIGCEHEDRGDMMVYFNQGLTCRTRLILRLRFSVLLG